MNRPQWTRTVRFRLTAMYSVLLFVLAAAALAIIYWAIAATTDAERELVGRLLDGELSA